MKEKVQGSGDLFGLAPAARATEKLTDGVVDGVAAFLGRICLPAAEEFGLLLRDQVGAWRQRNAVLIALEAEKQLSDAQAPPVFAPPRLAFAVLDHGSWIDDEHVRNMWAGLLASSCSPDGADDSNLIFIDLLSQLTNAQARILDHACARVEKECNSLGLVMQAAPLMLPLEELLGIARVDELSRLDREMDHLRSLDLLSAGICYEEPDPVDATPTALALYLHTRASGHSGTLKEFYEVSSGPDVKEGEAEG